MAAQARLAMTEAALCSMVYDVLLKQHFGGNFEALHAWWKQHQHASR
jgi:hypothetical protein